MTTKLGDQPGQLPGTDLLPTNARASLVAALGSVPGLVPFSTVPDVPVEGAAWPVWVQSAPPGWLAFPLGRGTYDVYVLLPAGQNETTVETADGLLGAVCGAVHPIAAIQLAEPVSVRFTDNTAYPGLRLRVNMRGTTHDNDGG